MLLINFLYLFLPYFVGFREAKRTLPRPKVGDFCSTAMEQGFSDACVSLCMDQRPVIRVAQTCRAAAVEMPRPTVRKWCEHGYNVAFSKATDDLATHFKLDNAAGAEGEAIAANPATMAVEESSGLSEPDVETVPESATVVTESAVDLSPVVTKIPVTVGGSNLDLLMHDGESAEDAVVAFCKEHVKDDVSACIRQMLPEVLERMEESQNGSSLRGSG